MRLKVGLLSDCSLRGNLRPIQKPTQNGYQFEHGAGQSLGHYISNGELIAVAFIVGYHYRYDQPNLSFGVRAVDLRRLRAERRESDHD